jgi:hypothetical protein
MQEERRWDGKEEGGGEVGCGGGEEEGEGETDRFGREEEKMGFRAHK